MLKRLFLTKDIRSNNGYYNFIGWTWVNKKKQHQYQYKFKKLKLFDPAINSYRKEKVIVRITDTYSKYAVGEITSGISVRHESKQD